MYKKIIAMCFVSFGVFQYDSIRIHLDTIINQNPDLKNDSFEFIIFISAVCM